MKNAFKLLAKSVLITLGLTAAVLAVDASIQNKKFWIKYENINNFEWNINDIMKIVKSLEESGLLIKSITETIKNETKGQQ